MIDVPLLHDLNLTVRAGERVAVLGPNGHGKSTLLKTIVGAIPALGGHVRIGASVKIGYLAQEQEILDPARQRVGRHPVGSAFESHRRALVPALFSVRGRRRIHAGCPPELRRASAADAGRAGGARRECAGAGRADQSPRRAVARAVRAGAGRVPGSVLAVVHDRYFVEKFATTIWHIADGELSEDIRTPLLA